MSVVDLLAAREGGEPAEAVAMFGRVNSGSGIGEAALYTWSGLEREVDRRARELASVGAQAGRVFPVVVRADAEGVLTLLALWRAGAVPAPLNDRLTDPEKDAAASALGGREAPGAQVVLWTSGTEGRPHGVALGFDAMASHSEAVRARLDLSGRDVWLASLSPAHVGGLMLLVRTVLLGSPLVAWGAISADETWGLIRGEGLLPGAGTPVTHLSLVPAQLRRLLDTANGEPPPATFRCALLGGAHTPRDLLDRALADGWPIALTYGMTEMSSQVATAPPARVRQKPGTVGKPLDGVEVSVGQAGELRVRGRHAALTYLDGSDLYDSDGWYSTGDAGHLDDAGDLWITGRLGGRIISGGVNVDPLEVEEALREHPAVYDVAVVGAPDEEWGEAVCALVVPVEGEFDLAEVQEWLRDRLAGAKRPKRWTLTHELPRNANGKVDRARARGLISEVRS